MNNSRKPDFGNRSEEAITRDIYLWAVLRGAELTLEHLTHDSPYQAAECASKMLEFMRYAEDAHPPADYLRAAAKNDHRYAGALSEALELVKGMNGGKS